MPRRKQGTESDDGPSTPEQLASLAGAMDDIGASALIVMMEAAKSAREDVKAIMAQVAAVNAAKRHQRELLSRINRDLVAAVVAEVEGRSMDFSPLGLGDGSAYGHVELAVPDPEAPERVRWATVSLADGDVTSLAQLEAAKEAVQCKLDSMSELGEMESLRLQMAMDRVSKMMSTLSNLLKRTSETGQTITQNMK